MKPGDARKIEQKWQKIWENKKLYRTDLKSGKPKYYCLVMFYYPSGAKLHIGHWYNFGPADSWARFMRMHGFNVFEPMGADAFGLPAENYAVKTGVHPKKTTEANIKVIQKQLKEMGAMYDWEKQINTSHPEYYQWTQWIFLQLYRKGLAYRKKAPANFCPNCQTVLANEQVQDGACERCGSQVTKKDLTQWFFKIRNYAEKLLDFTGLDWPEKTKVMQKNWIGRSQGSEIIFRVEGIKEKNPVFTTRADTLFGTTYLVLAPEHPLALKITHKDHLKNVKEYIEKARKESDIERASEKREKTGVFTGGYVLNPINQEKIPIWIADYVLPYYGTGAVMAVPAHDQRDFEFAKKYGLQIRPVIKPIGLKIDLEKRAFEEDGILFNSGKFNGLSSEKAREKITEWLKIKKIGNFKVDYRLRDWLISRQRYWGAPIPIIYCEKCGEVPVPEKDLPVKLPMEVDFKPKGKSPLATASSFVNTKCPKCKGKAKREVDTLDTFVCSSWYFYRYLSPHLKTKPFDQALVNKWLPVDMYIGGAEHACMHLLYARFIHKVMHDLGYVKCKEPFLRLVHQGTITKDGAKMSKSRGNVVSPDQFVKKYGSDVFRMYLMFMGPFTQGGDWSDKGIKGIARFSVRFGQLMHLPEPKVLPEKLKRLVHKTIKKVTEDIQNLHFNTAIAALMGFLNEAVKTGLDLENKKKIVKLIAPLAPHLAEEIWEKLQGKPADSLSWQSVFDSKWPKHNPRFLKEEEIELVIQINGKLRGKVFAPANIAQEKALEIAQEIENVKRHLAGKEIIKKIYVPGKLVNLVVR